MVCDLEVEAGRGKNDNERPSGGPGDLRPRRIGGRIPERAHIVNQHQAALDVDGVLANTGVRLTGLTQPQHNRPDNLARVVESKRQLRLHGAPVDDVYEAVDARQRLASLYAP